MNAPARALREVLEDRLVGEAVLAVLKGAALDPDDHAEYARGLGGALGRAGVRETLVAAWRKGPWPAFEEAVRTVLDDPPSPEVGHHLALVHGRFAATTQDAERAHRHLERALVLWLRVYEEHEYLAALASRIAGAEGPALLAGFAEVLLEPLAADLRAGRREPTDSARRALWGLRAVPGCAARAGLADAHRAEIEALALRLLDGIVREVLDEARIVAEQIDPLRADAEERSAPFRLILSFTSWAGLDPETIVFLLDQAQDQAWELYRARRMNDVGTLLAPLRPAVDELEARISKDTNLLAYRALCAQMLTFLGETESDPRAAIANLERAVAVCPTHRNARLILAGLLIDEALRQLRSLPTLPIFGGGESRRRGLAEVRRLHDRALTLWPEAKIPQVLQAALADA